MIIIYMYIYTHLHKYTYTDQVPPVGCVEGPPLHIFVGELLLLGEGHLEEAILPHGASAANPPGRHLVQELEGGSTTTFCPCPIFMSFIMVLLPQ